MRRLSDNSIFFQYHKEGKAYDGSFPTWELFSAWLVSQENITVKVEGSSYTNPV
jgi:hypothetical protein